MTDPRARSIRKAVVDTGPLLSALVLDYVRASPPTRHDSILSQSRISDYLLESKAHQIAFLQLFDAIRIVLTTSNVVGEVQGLQSLRDQYQREFWLGGMRLLRRKNLDERLIRLLDLESDDRLRQAISVIGPTDTGLVELARQEQCVLLTDDRELRWRARAQGVESELVKDLVSRRKSSR